MRSYKMADFTITDAQYENDRDGNKIMIVATINDTESCWITIPSEGNVHYDEIMRQVKAGTLTIAEAD